MSCFVTAYAMKTIAGTENTIDLSSSHGFTGTKKCSACMKTDTIADLYQEIKAVLQRALKMQKENGEIKERVSLIISSNFYENKYWEQNVEEVAEHENYFIVKKLVEEFGVNKQVLLVSTACSSGGSAIITACQLLNSNQTDQVILLGYEILSQIPCNGMDGIGALTKETITPFSKGRTGTQIGEGIGVLILEKQEAESCFEVAGYGSYCDAYNVTTPEPEGKALEDAIRASINMAGIPEEQVSYINAHGSGTKLNDKLESKVIKRVFREHAYKMFVNSSKALFGHTLGAAGVVEAVLTLVQLQLGTIHPTANFTEADEECDLNNCFTNAIKKEIQYAISTSIGFGGINTCILFRKV